MRRMSLCGVAFLALILPACSRTTVTKPPSDGTAGKPNRCSVIGGSIRAGRDRETRARLLTDLSQAWVSITGQDARSILIALNDVDPTSIMEAGLIMPAPGEEAEWLERNQEVLGELLASQ